MFSLFSHTVSERVCVATFEGKHFFGAFLLGRTFLYADEEKCMSKDNFKKVIDVTGVELTPGEPDVCLGNGEQGFECCCDECDYYLLCFSEFDPKKQKN